MATRIQMVRLAEAPVDRVAIEGRGRAGRSLVAGIERVGSNMKVRDGWSGMSVSEGRAYRQVQIDWRGLTLIMSGPMCRTR